MFWIFTNIGCCRDGTGRCQLRFTKAWQGDASANKNIVKHVRSKISHSINLCEEQVLSSIYGLFSFVKVIWIHSQFSGRLIKSVNNLLNNNGRDNAMCSCHDGKCIPLTLLWEIFVHEIPIQYTLCYTVQRWHCSSPGKRGEIGRASCRERV